MKVFDVAAGTIVRAFEGHTGHVLAVAWKGDGSNLATGGADNAIKVWTFLTGEQVQTITTHQKQVTDVDYVGVTDNIVSCSGGAAVRYHQASNGRFYREFSGNTDYVYAAEANRNEKLVVAGGQDGVLRVWNGENSQLLMSFDPPAAAEEAATVGLNP
jgi:WD40 repeat protein